MEQIPSILDEKKNIDRDFMEILRELSAAEYCKCDPQRGNVWGCGRANRIESNRVELSRIE